VLISFLVLLLSEAEHAYKRARARDRATFQIQAFVEESQSKRGQVSGRQTYRVEVSGVGLKASQLHVVEQGGCVVLNGVAVGKQGVVHEPCREDRLFEMQTIPYPTSTYYFRFPYSRVEKPLICKYNITAERSSFWFDLI
jgi:hypothetical protein